MSGRKTAGRRAATGLVVLGLLGGAAVAAPARAAEVAHWSYEGEFGPDHWADLPGNALCADAGGQSPVDLAHAQVKRLSPTEFHLPTGPGDVVDNGHTVLAYANPADHTRPAPRETFEVGGARFALLQMHYHVPSEHTVNGVHHAGEAHFVFVDAAGHLTVVGAFLDGGGPTNRHWKPFVDAVGAASSTAAPVALDWAALLPSGRGTVRYPGSLTTPPCTEGVAWNVEVDPVRLSDAQIAALKAKHDGTNRPVQPWGARVPVTDARFAR